MIRSLKLVEPAGQRHLLQYILIVFDLGVTGTISSYNYQGGTHLANQVTSVGVDTSHKKLKMKNIFRNTTTASDRNMATVPSHTLLVIHVSRLN